MLVHHAEARRRRRPAGSARPQLAPGAEHRPRVGAVQPVQHRHQGRLAGAVLADDGVDLAGGQLEVGVDQGTHGPERLADPGHRQRSGVRRR